MPNVRPEMSDSYHYDGEQSSTSSSDGKIPNHLGTSLPLHQFDGHKDPEKLELPAVATLKPHELPEDEEEEDEDIDALIDDLESQDGQEEELIEDEVGVGETPPISEDFLNTSRRTGLTDAEVLVRRKKFGMNQMKEEKENLILKFLGYFVGPIQFVMEVSSQVLLCSMLFLLNSKQLKRSLYISCCSLRLAPILLSSY